MTRPSKIRATNKYNKKAYNAFTIRFSKQYDREVLEKLNSVENKTDYLRQLILNDIRKNIK